MKTARLNCAIYTRKSHEAGLEQEFNSLDAQREAGEAFIKSQAHEGWKVLPTLYDDGGFSGGSLERPALQSLMVDIKAGKVDVIVVYKVDRLTRSLADFAKLIEMLDEHKVSFVSVTQQFNTTSSMGRLTLNVLLSFAQFEREVTGERIRDKFLASRKKGMWMGGPPPLGYDIKDRKLTISSQEADVVRHIFTRYVEVKNVRELEADLKRSDHRTKRWVSRSGRHWGGGNFSRGTLYTILSNRLYIGKAVHKGIAYDGEHEAILHTLLWDRVQALLIANRQDKVGRAKTSTSHLLKGKLFTSDGVSFQTNHACKQGKRYRYYVSTCKTSKIRLPALDFDTAIAAGLRQRLGIEDQYCDSHVLELIERCQIEDDCATIVLSSLDKKPRGIKCISDDVFDNQDPSEPILIPMQIRKKHNETRIRVPGQKTQMANPDPSLIKAIVKGYAWREQIENGVFLSVREMARNLGLTHRYVGRLLRLGYLAPDIIEAILDGTQPEDLALADFHTPFPNDWNEQRKLFGFAQTSLVV